jgi:hypothetical protein
MAFKHILAALLLLAGVTTMVTTASDVDAAPKKKVYKVVKYKKVVKKKIVVRKYVAPKPVTGCTNVTLTGGGMKKGLAGTESKASAAAVADWERQARARFGNTFLWATAAGKQVSCKRDVITVRCLAIAVPCSK